jgi:hypothetical protein
MAIERVLLQTRHTTVTDGSMRKTAVFKSCNRHIHRRCLLLSKIIDINAYVNYKTLYQSPYFRLDFYLSTNITNKAFQNRVKQADLSKPYQFRF